LEFSSAVTQELQCTVIRVLGGTGDEDQTVEVLLLFYRSLSPVKYTFGTLCETLYTQQFSDHVLDIRRTILGVLTEHLAQNI